MAAEVSSSSRRMRTHLFLEKKVEIIRKSKDNPCWHQEKWETCYHVKVSGVTVHSWKERLPEIVSGYDKNIYNLEETGCFWRALPERGLVEKGKRCNRGKKAS